MAQPAPAVQFVDFVEHGLQFTLSYFISDPRNGQGNLRSDVNAAVLQGLRAAGVTLSIPRQAVQFFSEKEGAERLGHSVASMQVEPK